MNTKNNEVISLAVHLTRLENSWKYYYAIDIWYI